MLNDDIIYTLNNNFGRVKNLLTLYETYTELKKGRKSAKSSDLLRVTVVLLHATLEDFLRSLLKSKLPDSGKAQLMQIPLFKEGDYGRNPKFNLGDLYDYKEQKVDDIIKLSVHHYLDRQSFNNVSEISAALESISINITLEIKSHYVQIGDMIKRRHNIVHQADRERQDGQGYHRIKSISWKQVNGWISSVDEFISKVAKQLQNGKI